MIYLIINVSVYLFYNYLKQIPKTIFFLIRHIFSLIRRISGICGEKTTQPLTEIHIQTEISDGESRDD